jgi:hypothetical protein
MDQLLALSKQQLDYVKQETTVVTGFIKQSNDDFVSFIKWVIGGGLGLLLFFGAVLSWLGWGTRKDMEENVHAGIAKMQQRATAEIGEEVEKISAEMKNTTDTEMKKTTDTLNKRVANTAEAEMKKATDTLNKVITNTAGAEMKKATDTLNKVIAEGKGAFKRLSTGLTEKQFNERVRDKKILWVDDCHEENNLCLIDLLRTSGATLDCSNTTAEAKGLFGGKTYDIIISDTITIEDGRKDEEAAITLFDHLPSGNQAARKIINTGEYGLKKYSWEPARQHGIDAVVSSDSRLVEAILGLPKNSIQTR